MKKDGVGGSKTQKSGSEYELLTQNILLNDLLLAGYISVQTVETKPGKILYAKFQDKKGSAIEVYFQGAIYKQFFEKRAVYARSIFTALLLPDTAIFSEKTNTLTIIEKKQQKVEGSVAEKLQTCDYKLYYYRALCKPIGVEVDLVWQLGSYFQRKQDTLHSVFEYMLGKGSRYFFDQIPIDQLRI